MFRCGLGASLARRVNEPGPYKWMSPPNSSFNNFPSSKSFIDLILCLFYINLDTSLTQSCPSLWKDRKNSGASCPSSNSDLIETMKRAGEAGRRISSPGAGKPACGDITTLGILGPVKASIFDDNQSSIRELNTSGERIARLLKEETERILNESELQNFQHFLSKFLKRQDSRALHNTILAKFQTFYAAEILESGESLNRLRRSSGPENAILGRFSNFFQKKYSKRDQPYSQAANPFGQYIELSDLSQIPHFCLLFLSILLITSHLFIINFINERGLIIMTLMIILISF